MNFNPHEREARDSDVHAGNVFVCHFNPHEREARDVGWSSAMSAGQDFNPHEREARDVLLKKELAWHNILIHTSV